ncbi:hypothetical protein DPMN_027390 [Dreissena polymorpha]|uniref:Uncharacterized protein n=1 Tax=Dreissena polymorpha TaxID=45954 RepID=A0A9D4REC3_DREPO|nr:hypothetical protein DPMN_027390 [Dreissena polymorpha]
MSGTWLQGDFLSHVSEVIDLRVPLNENLTLRRLGFLMAFRVQAVRKGTYLSDLTRFSVSMGYTSKGESGNPSRFRLLEPSQG